MITLIDKITMLKNVKRYSIIAGAAIFMAACGGQAETTATVTPEGPSADEVLSQQSVNATLWSGTSAEAHYIYLQTYHFAIEKLEQKIAKMGASDRPKAVVMDLDETVLDNSPFQFNMIQNGQVFNEAAWMEWVQSASAKALPGALNFVNYCESRGIEVFYVSNRSESTMVPTMQNLRNLGFPFVDEAYVLLMVADESDKTSRRDAVASSHDVLLYLGDNLRDYREAFADRGADMGVDMVDGNSNEMFEDFVLFPNPMYGDWTRPYRSGDLEKELDAKKVILNDKSILHSDHE